jgi:hypothetical protein
MKKTENGIPSALRILLLISLLITFSIPGKAQASESESAEKKITVKKGSDTQLKLYAETGVEYTDNAFRLTGSQISKLEANAAEDAAGGRFKKMDSVSDYIISPEIGLNFNSSSPLGGKFSMTSWMRYNYYRSNQDSSFPEGRIRLKNSIGQKGALTLEGNFLFGYFKKNYISGVNDLKENGNVTRAERVYSHAVYDEYEGVISYEYKLINNKESRISGLDIRPFTGYGIRRHNSTFSNRDQDIPFLGLEFTLEFLSKIELEMTYKYEGVSAPGNQEFILFDETVAGVDINDDGEIKGNAPLITDIDRSSRRHSIEINPSIKFSKDTQLFFGYRKRVSSYSSDNQLDFEHYNQKAYRDQIRSGIIHDFSKAWNAEVEYSRTAEDEEDGDYSENNFLFKIKYDIN